MGAETYAKKLLYEEMVDIRSTACLKSVTPICTGTRRDIAKLHC